MRKLKVKCMLGRIKSTVLLPPKSLHVWLYFKVQKAACCSSCSALISCYPSALYNPLQNHQNIPFTAKHLHKSKRKNLIFITDTGTFKGYNCSVAFFRAGESIKLRSKHKLLSGVNHVNLLVWNAAFSCLMHQSTKILAVHMFSTTATVWWIWVLSLVYWFW